MNKPEGRYAIIGSNIGSDHLITGDILHEWPLHITVVPPFSFDAALEPEIHHTVQQHADAFHHIDVQVGEHDWFGSNHTIRASRVASDELVSLHRNIIDDFNQMGISVPSNYIGERYVPHISNQGNRAAFFGQTISLHSIYLVAKLRRADDDGKIQVRHMYPFGVFFD